MKVKLLLCVLAVLLFGAAWSFQRRAAADLRSEITRLNATKQKEQQLRAERAQLNAKEELDKMRADREEIAHLREEINRLRQRADDRARAAASGGAVATKAERGPSISEGFASFKSWENKGQSAPDDALQTSLWAAAGGDLKMLANTLALGDTVRQKAHALLDRLPPEVSSQFHTAEEFLALLMTPDVPLSSARIFDPKANVPEGIAARVIVFSDEHFKQRPVQITLYRIPNGEWRLLVPEAAVDKYAAMLTAPENSLAVRP